MLLLGQNAGILPRMKKIMIAVLTLHYCLPGAALFTQDTSQSQTDTSSTTTTQEEEAQEQEKEGHGQHGFNNVFNVFDSNTSSSPASVFAVLSAKNFYAVSGNNSFRTAFFLEGL